MRTSDQPVEARELRRRIGEDHIERRRRGALRGHRPDVLIAEQTFHLQPLHAGRRFAQPAHKLLARPHDHDARAVAMSLRQRRRQEREGRIRFLRHKMMEVRLPAIDPTASAAAIDPPAASTSAIHPAAASASASVDPRGFRLGRAGEPAPGDCGGDRGTRPLPHALEKQPPADDVVTYLRNNSFVGWIVVHSCGSWWLTIFALAHPGPSASRNASMRSSTGRRLWRRSARH